MFRDHFHLCLQSVIYYLKLMLISKDLISKFYASFEFHLNWFIIMNVKILINYVIIKCVYFEKRKKFPF